MKTYKFLILLTLIFATFSYKSKAQSKNQTTPESITKEILHNDSLFWNAYNSCDVENIQKFFTEDLEFYHDRSGLTKSLDSFMESIRNGMCNGENPKLRREAIEESINVYPIGNSGAIISGEHLFYVKENGKDERLDAKAKFFHFWKLENRKWKMSRVFSYDHNPVQFKQEKKEISLSDEILLKYVGSYKSQQTGIAEITKVENYLHLKSGGFQAVLFPETENTFFIKERDIEFKFVSNDNDKSQKLLILQNENIVDEAVKVE